MDNENKALLRSKLEKLKKKQEKTRLDNVRKDLAENIPDFCKKYRFPNSDEVQKIENFISKLHFSSPAHIVIGENTPSLHRNMYLCFLCGSEELSKIYVYGDYRDLMLDMEHWDFFSPYLLLIDEDFVRYIYINDRGEKIETRL